MISQKIFKAFNLQDLQIEGRCSIYAEEVKDPKTLDILLLSTSRCEHTGDEDSLLNDIFELKLTRQVIDDITYLIKEVSLIERERNNTNEDGEYDLRLKIALRITLV